MGISIALLAYKEAENLKILLPKIINEIEKTNENYEILVIDVEKPLDDTEEVCNEFDAKYINQEFPNFGGALKTAIKYANMDKFLILDADGSHDPIYIMDIYNKFIDEKCDVVIGSRYINGGKTTDETVSIFMSVTLNIIFRKILGIDAKDVSTDFRMYDTKQLKEVDLNCRNYDILQEVLVRMKLNNKKLKIEEIPITFNKRIYGESKRQLIPFIIDYGKSLFALLFLKYSFLKNLIMYGIIGIGGAIVEYSVFSLLMLTGLIPEISNIIGAVLGFAFTFNMNTFFNFKKSNKILKRLLYYGLICFFGMVFSTYMIYLFKNSINIYMLKAFLLIFLAIIQFLLNKFITYKD